MQVSNPWRVNLRIVATVPVHYSFQESGQIVVCEPHDQTVGKSISLFEIYSKTINFLSLTAPPILSSTVLALS